MDCVKPTYIDLSANGTYELDAKLVSLNELTVQVNRVPSTKQTARSVETEEPISVNPLTVTTVASFACITVCSTDQENKNVKFCKPRAGSKVTQYEPWSCSWLPPHTQTESLIDETPVNNPPLLIIATHSRDGNSWLLGWQLGGLIG